MSLTIDSHSDQLVDNLPNRSTLVELLRWRAEHQADQLAHTFLAEGNVSEATLTYAEMDREARRIAGRLQSLDAKGERVLLLYPPGLEFISAFFGCLYAGAVAVPVYPPRRNRNLLRLLAIVADSESSIVMTTGATLAKVQPWFAETPQLKNVRLIASDSLDDQSEQEWRESVIDKNTLAFLQYTSGSTGRPKGVMLTHENLLFNAALVYSAVDHAPGDKYVSWLPTFHDMGFMAGILQPLYGGFQSVLMSPAAFLQRPLSWLEAITHYRATTSGAPNFAYDLCVRKVNAEQKATLDLSSWTVAFNGAEPIRLETLERFAEAFAPCGFRREAFYPCYGLAEATLMVSGSLKTSAPVSKRIDAKALMDHRVVESPVGGENDPLLVGCGRNLGSQKIVIVRPETSVECAAGEVGEIWVTGTSVAQGYWRKPELTEETFHARLAGSDEGPFLRTGDLGFIDAGELFVTGRLKDLVIIRGFNHYPQDIELTVEKCHRALRPGCGAAFAVEAAGEERLVVVYEVDQRQEVNLTELRERIISAIAEEHELQTYAVVFIRQGSVPKTSSGKIQRHACRKGFLDHSLEVIEEWQLDLTTDQSPVELSFQETGDIDAWLRQQIAGALKVPVSQLDLEKPLAQYGLDSLAALELIYSTEIATGVSLSLASFLQDFSISDLAAEIRAELSKSSTVSAELSEETPAERQALSRGQQALWFLYRLAPESAAYNIAGAVRLVGEVDAAALRQSFQALVDRHESLRTIYREQGGKPVQDVLDFAEVSFNEEDAASWNDAELDQRLRHEANVPFSLETGPLLRIALFRRSAHEHVLLLVVHHIAVDFWSLGVLIHELGLLYRSQTTATLTALDPPPLRYSDYVRSQEKMLRSPEGDRLWAYWQKQLAGDLPVIDLPTDRPRPAVQTFEGASHAFKLDPSLTQKLKAVARDQGATLYMLLLASFQILLHRYTGQKDILVGSPAAGRGRADLAGLVGYFVNPLVLRADFSRNPTVSEFVNQVRETVLDAYRHQDYPFAVLVERLQPDRDPARSPLFQVMFTFHQSHLRDKEDLAQFALGEIGAQMNVGGLQLESMALEQRVAQFDLTLMMAEARDGLMASLQYNRDLFDHRTIAYMAQHFENLLRAVVSADEVKTVRELAWLSESEREEIVYGWNETATVVESELSIAEEFGARARELGSAVALVSGREEVTYEELNEKANQLGHYLRRLGVGPETVVGVCLERSVELVVGLLGVLKAGGAYLPLDPSYPRERVEWMLTDAGVQVVVSEEHLREVLGEYTGRVVCLDSESDQIVVESREDLLPGAGDENLAYVIYTSGSTGRPKGVMVQQGNVKNFFCGMDQSLSAGVTDGKRETWLAVTSVSFDISVLELLWSLRRGSRVVLQSEVVTREAARESQPELAQQVEQESTRESGSVEGEEAETRELDFSLFYFAATASSNGHGGGRESYRLLLEGARYADEHGYKAVWTPERHFHEFGGLYPNPAVTSAALATITERVELRAGSVVLPLHNPVRVAEEWSVIDNLSGGRVGVSFASGWHADDFVLAPDHYAHRHQVMEEGIELVRRLWRGEGARLRGGSGQEVEVRIQPRPVQRELPVWVTAAGAVETFRQAGRLGAGVLTHLLGQSVEEVGAKVAAYREAWREAGHAGRGQVTLMLHTFVGAKDTEVKRQVRQPMLDYLSSSLGLIERMAKSLGKELGDGRLSGSDYDEVLEYAFERYYEKSGLLGSVEKCVGMIRRLRRLGIDEVACLIDFGPGVAEVLESLQYLEEVRRRSRAEAVAARRRRERSISIGDQLQRHEVTHLQCTPTLAGALWQDAETRAGLSRLQQLMCGGEALPGGLAGVLCETVRGTVHNMYGPTETTIWSSTHEVNETDASTPIVSLGRPIANTQIFLLDEALQPVPVGVRGELYIGGDGVARGYWNRGELTAERFVPDPFSKRGGQRLYRTGDEARYLANGEIEYLGRSDQQVKLRGYRIELGEIEAALREHESVASAAVAVHGDRLVAYVVPAIKQAAGGELTAAQQQPLSASPTAEMEASASHAQQQPEFAERTSTGMQATLSLSELSGPQQPEFAERTSTGMQATLSLSELSGPQQPEFAERTSTGMQATLSLSELSGPQQPEFAERTSAGMQATLSLSELGAPQQGQDSAELKPVQTQATVSASELRAHLQQRLPEYMVPSYFMTLAALPQTPNGKLDRKALPEPDPGAGLSGSEYEAPRTPAEEVLAAIVAEVLQVPRVGRQDDFFALGGHSLLAMQVISRIREAFQVELPVRVLFESPTLAGLARYLEQVRSSDVATSEAPPLRRLDRNQPLPLSFAQQRLWFLDRFEADRHLYNVPVRVELRGALDHARLEESLNRVLQRHEVLRTSFREVDGQPVQQIEDVLTLQLPLVDLSGWSEGEREAKRIADAELYQPFNLAQAPLWRAQLVRLSADNHLLLLTLHHAVCDGWSLGVLLKEVVAYYERGEAAELPVLPVQYADYAAWQREWLQGPVLDQQLNYWRERLQGAPAALELATDYPRPALHRYRGATLSYQLDTSLSSEMQALSQREGVTLLMLLLGSLQLLLSRYTGAQDISVGLPVAGRNRVESEPLVGLFLNTLVLRTEWQGNPTFRELLGRVREVALGAYAHQELPFEKLVEELQPERDLSRTPLFQVMLVMQNAPLPEASQHELQVGALEVATRSTNYDLTLSVTETGEGLQVLLDYNALLFREERMQRLLRHWERLLQSVVDGPSRRVLQLSWLTDAEREEIVYGWNQTGMGYSREASVTELIAAQAAQHPQAVAVMGDGAQQAASGAQQLQAVAVVSDGAQPAVSGAQQAATGARQLSYAELNQRANQLARYLRKLGVGPETVVGVCLERTVLLPVALLGVLKAGGAYLPLDPSYPRERLEWVLADAGVQVVLSEEHLRPVLGSYVEQPSSRVVCLDGGQEQTEIAEESTDELVSDINSDNLAYLIYTSGSTGRPKGVGVTHGNLVNFLLSMQREPGLTAADTLVAVTTLSFDIAGLELYLPLISGGRLVLADRETATDGHRLLKLLRERHATVMQATPATWRLLLDALATEEAKEPLELKVLCGGEALPGSLAAELRETFKGAVYNLYGPTETTIWSAIHEVNVRDGETPIVSLGRPIANTQLYLLDEALQPVPVGVRGELYIGGDGVARGYWNRGELTAERFVPDPFSKRGGQRLYWTGDEARYLANGEIEYLGRSDQQVKLRGYRIELGEIEAALREHESVASAAVAVRGERLVAYVVPVIRQAAADADSASHLRAQRQHAEHLPPATQTMVSASELRAHLQQRLPEYMVPSYFMTLAALPQTPNGKLDRKALPEPEPGAGLTGTEYEAPRTPVEEVLAAIVAEVLQVPRVGRQDDFFALGGHSLLASQLLFRLQRAFQLDLSLLSIFQKPKVADLAAHISRLKASDSEAEYTVEEFPSITADPAQRYQPFPLTDVQQAYWIGRTNIFELGNVATHIAIEVESTGLHIARLNLALQRLIERHEMLRAIVLPDGQQQILESVPPYQIQVLDLRDMPAEARAARLDEVREKISHQVLRADQWPLFEIRASVLDDQHTRVHVSFDLLIGDARSFQIISQELKQLYEHPDQPIDKLDLSFRDYVMAEAQLQESALYKRSQQYWLDRLPSLPPAPDLPLAKIPNTITQPRFVRRYGELPRELWQQLKHRATRAGITPSGVLMAAFAEVLSVWSKSPKFTINLTLFNRLPLHEQVNDIVGDFTSLTLLAVDNSELQNFETRARRIQAQLWSDMDHRYLSGVQVLREVARAQGGKAGATMPVVFTSMLSLPAAEAPDANSGASDGWSLNWLGKQVYGISQTPQVWLDHQAFEDQGRLGFNWDAVEELFPEALLDDMFDAYLRLLHSLAESDEEWQVTTHELMPAAQSLQRAEINATEMPVSDELLHTFFASQVDQRANQPAVIHTDRTLTYQELFAQSNQLGHWLRRSGARPNKLVAVVMEKGWEQTVAVLGILQAGAAYLPIEATLPPERINYLLDQGEADFVVTQRWLDTKFEWPEHVRRIYIGSDELAAESVEPLPSVQQPEDLAYVIFTSGSTGQPKGVMIDHRGAVNTVLDINKRFHVGPNDRVLALSSLSFDLSVWDIFGMLAAGGTIVVPDAASRRDPKHWAELVARHKITIWNSVPALMNIQVDHLSERGREALESLRLVMMSGDWIPVSLPDRIKELVEGIEVVSLGGATEASIWSILYPIEEVDPNWKSIPYGRPMWNQSWQILNERLEPCPVWTVGELYIGGIGLAKGYWRDEQKTNRSFITHPRTGERLYRTGDLGRYLPDGNIEFLGREDSQVKIQGYRIELGEIEAALEEHQNVRAAVVNAFGEQRGSKRLIGYIVPEQTQPTSAELQLHLKAKLPEYMIPTTFMFLDKLPLSSNGKVDRRALPEPERIRQDEAILVAPGNWKEQALVEIWAKVLGLEQISINDNFFELGGDSILSIRAAAQASEAGLRLTPDQIFQYRTIAELSSVVGTTEVVEAEQGTITGNVPLTPIQHWFFEQDFIHPHHWNQALLLEVRQTLDPALLRQAVHRLLAHHDALRLRFTRDANGWQQENADVEADVPFEWRDLSALDESEQSAAVEAIAAETQASLDLAYGPLLRIVSFEFGAGKPGRLLIVIHHLVVDGVSWRILLDDLERTYDALKRGEAVSLPPKTTSYKQWSEKLIVEAESGAFDDEIGYWTSVLQQPVANLPLDYAETFENTAQSARLVTKSLSERDTRALLYEISEAYHTQINEVLLTALAEGFRRWTGERRVLVDVEGHGREAIVSSVDLARTVGWFTAIYPVQLKSPVAWEPGPALRQTKEQLRAVPRAGVGYGILKYLAHTVERRRQLRAGAAAVSFNYLGQLDQVISGSALYQLAPESAGPVYSPEGKRTHVLAFYGSVFGGQFQLSIEYSQNLHREATIEKLAEDFMTALRAIITHCTSGDTFTYTPSDFPLINVDQDQLEKAFSLVEFEE